jgi:integrase
MARHYGTKGAIHIEAVQGSEDDTGRPKWSVSFSVDLPSGETHRERKRLSNRSKEQAHKWAEKRRNELLAPAPKAPTAFAELVKLYRKRHLPTLSPAYQDKIISTLDHRLLPAFGKLRLAQITRGTIDDYLTTLRKTCEPKAQRDHLALLHKLLSLAVEWELLSTLPSFPKVKVPAPDVPEFLTHEEHDQLLSKARNHEEYTLLLFATDSGTRSGEQIALQWGDIRGQQLVLQRSVVKDTVASGFKSTKSGKPRVVALSNRAQQALAKLKAERLTKGLPCGDTDLVFGNYVESVKALYKRVVRACDRAGVKATSRHGLRHTHASWLARAGVPPVQIQANLGHSSLAMTGRYLHLIPGTGDEVRAAFDGPSNATSSSSGLTTE